MSIFDGVVLVIIATGFVQGRWKGMAWQLAPIASLIIGYVVAFPMAGQLAPWFGDSAPMNYLLALLVLYLAVSLSVYLLARSVKDYIVKFKLEEYDKHLGSLLGGVKSVLFCLVIMFFSVAMSAKARDYLIETHSGYAAAIVMDALHPVMPAEAHDAIEPYIHALDQPGMDLQHSHGDAEPGHDSEQVASGNEEESLLPPLPTHDDGHEVTGDSVSTGNADESPHDHETAGSQPAEEGTREEEVVRGVLRVLEAVTKE